MFIDLTDFVGIVIGFLVLLALALSCFKVVKQSRVYIIERLGKFHTIWNPGLHFKIPVVDRIAEKVSLKERVSDFPPQPVITKDNVTMRIDTVVYWIVTDTKAFTYGVEDPVMAIRNLTATTLRNIIGEFMLDDTLTSRDNINSKLLTILDAATDKWGIKVNRVEVQNIQPPAEIQEAMEKQMRAEREKREKILKAEGTKEAAILEAQGEKESQVLKAEAEKQVLELKAQGRANARTIEAQAEAEAIIRLKEAESKGIERLKVANADNAVLSLKAYEAFVEACKGDANKVIIPADLQNITGVFNTVKEALK